MDFFKSVVVKNDKLSFSGVQLFEKYVLITSHLVHSLSDLKDVDKVKDPRIWAIKQCDDKGYIYFETKEVYLIGDLFNSHIKNIVSHCFNDLYDYTKNIVDIQDLFTIHVLCFDPCETVKGLRQLWLSKMAEICHERDLRIGNEIFIRAAPFGSRQLIGSYSQGIVSNCVGGVLITDCPTVIGCEGGFVIKKDGNIPLGVVVSTMVGWRGESIGLTIAITFNGLFCNCGERIKCKYVEVLSSGVLSNQNNINSLVYIKSGYSWGTGICVDKDQGLFITNAHVITRTPITVLSGNVNTQAHVLFQASPGQPYDLAVLKCDDLSAFNHLKSAVFSKHSLGVGDAVFTLGFPLFSHGKNMAATMTKGHVSLLKNDLIMTTCAVLPGASGGALCDMNGDLVGIITCNIINTEEGRSYPRVNMNIPAQRIESILRRFMKNGDINILKELSLDEERKADWMISKL